MQLRMYKTPDLETPEYQILKRAADYEVSFSIHLGELCWLYLFVCGCTST